MTKFSRIRPGFILNIFILVALLIYLYRDRIIYLFFTPRGSAVPVAVVAAPSPSLTGPVVPDIRIVARDLLVPWEIAFLPGGDMLVTERSGRLLRVGAQTSVITQIAGVRSIGEGGLLGMALHPGFSGNGFIYLYSTTADTAGLTNRVERYKFTGTALSDRKVILSGIRGSSNHDGGRIAFGPDGYLYITTGDAEDPRAAQDRSSLNGKILRVDGDGGIPSDNPFGNAVYSLGHRNPQGLAWDKNGVLWETEHGPSGAGTGYDELNVITRGSNYGWPDVVGGETRPGFVPPVVQSGSADTWAPSGMAYLNGNLYFSGLRGEALYQARIISPSQVTLSSYFKREYGRIRAVVAGPDGFIYITTSNTDGRGRKQPGDDRIIRINPQVFR